MYRRERGYGNRLLSEKYAKSNLERHKKKINDARSATLGSVMMRKQSPVNDKYASTLN